MSRAVHIVPVTIREATAFVLNFHRHNEPPRGAIFAIGASDGAALVGVVMVGRPVGRGLQDGRTAEVTRCCVVEAAPKGTPSALYGAAWRAARAMGWQRLVTYTLVSEGGASLRGAGWKVVAEIGARDPGDWQNRPGREWHPVVGQAKLRWEAPA